MRKEWTETHIEMIAKVILHEIQKKFLYIFRESTKIWIFAKDLLKFRNHLLRAFWNP